MGGWVSELASKQANWWATWWASECMLFVEYDIHCVEYAHCYVIMYLVIFLQGREVMNLIYLLKRIPAGLAEHQ